MFNIILKPFNSKWSSYFLEETPKIVDKLGEDNILSVAHIGSTSIDNMVANEVIDMAVCLNHLESIDHYRVLLAQLGYRDVGYFKQDNWYIFGRFDSKFHIHLGPYKSDEMVSLLLFKLYLSKHDDYKEYYTNLKEFILENTEKTLYEFNKQDFVFSTVRLAKLEYLSGGISESDFEIIYKNAYINDKEKMTKAIIDFCLSSKEELKDQIPQYKELHYKNMEEVKEKLESSPFLLRFSMKNLEGEIVELDEKSENFMKMIMTNSLIRNYMRFHKTDPD